MQRCPMLVSDVLQQMPQTLVDDLASFLTQQGYSSLTINVCENKVSLDFRKTERRTARLSIDD